jgi:tetratricopeptide (TPR) repeat protein
VKAEAARILLPAALVLLARGAAAQAVAVRAWEGTETIPTYEEGPPDPNPPFDLLSGGRFNYPYTLRENVTDRRASRVWRTLNLENEHLRVSVLPDLGGRLWRSVDKANGAQMFYANPSLKFAQVAYRGAWATFGVEFNFPVSHSWVTSSPVDFALRPHADGSASLVVGNVDLVYGMQWRVALTLRPGRSVLEQETTLYNPGGVRHRFYWWTNAAVEVWDDSRLLYPMRHTATHGFTQVDTWPVDSQGTDLARPGNHLHGAVSLFSHGSREPFMGVYHPRTRAGVVHWADPLDLPAQKVWSWGGDAEGLDWRRALSDNGSAEVEVQAGLFRNQETYAFLGPQESLRFRELWMPVREIGGFSRATPDAIVNVTRDGGALVVGLQVTLTVRGGRLRIRDGTRVVADEALDLSPAGTLVRRYPAEPANRYTVEVADGGGRVLLTHTEGVLDLAPPSEVLVGAQPRRVPPPREAWTEGDFVERGTGQELEGKGLRAWDTYREGLARFPEGLDLLRAAGRLAVGLKRFAEAVPPLQAVLSRTSNDADAQYALGLAQAALGEDAKAQPLWEASARFRTTRAASLLQLARLRARNGDPARALALVRGALREEPDMVRGGGLEIALLRRAGRGGAARARLAHWRAIDPTSGLLRHEAVLLGHADPGLWSHLAGDPQRVLEIAVDLMEAGAWDDALRLLAREYPTGEGVHGEPGLPPPQRHPEVVYYRGYCRERMGQSGRADFDAASRLPTTYVFPQRAATLPVLRKALEASPGDATARFLMGSLLASGGMVDGALAEWAAARRLDPRRPVLHRNMGLTLIHAGRFEEAREVLTEGLAADPRNPEVYLGLDQVLGILGRPPEERIRALQGYPDPAAMPQSLVFKLVLALVEARRFEEAEALFHGRFFPREEFGTDVRQVYLEVGLQRALALARAGRPEEARRAAALAGQPAAGLDFTNSGLAAFAEAPRAQYLLGQALSLAGDQAGARRAWEAAAAGGDRYPHLDAAYALLAARRLGLKGDGERRARLEAALLSWVNRLSVGTNYPGANAMGQGYFLRVLGREDEARGKLREALLLPEKMMSHYLSRAVLGEKEPW